jgi:CheY-like chemotaxis protein/anti-sigma regulatory factor (Ser/Thr protein kinase)
VAHEINTPLACVIGNLARLEEHAAAQAGALPAAVRAELAEALRDVREGAEHVWTIARDLRAFAHPAADRPEPVDVRKVLATTLRLTRGEICPRARLVERITEVPRVAAHESRLVQVFLNLLVNAAEALPTGNPDGNEVVVRTAIAPDGRVLVEIRDSGCGIPPENLGRVFDPFFTTKPVGVGTGLGLPICRSIVSDLGGEVLLQSEVGRGTTARVLLPSAAPAGSAGTTSAPDRSGPPRRGRVLVVDDEPAVGRFLRPALAQEHEVDVATGAREALDLVVSGARYDAILCDLVMPRMTGMELHAALARVAPEQAERVVFLSGGALTSEAQAFLERAGQRRLDKPVDLEDLRATVRALVR